MKVRKHFGPATRYRVGVCADRIGLWQWFSIHFEACTSSGRKNYFRTPSTIFIKKENKQNVCNNLRILHPKQDFAPNFDEEREKKKVFMN